MHGLPQQLHIDRGRDFTSRHVAQHEPEPDDGRFSPVLYTVADVKSSPQPLLSNLLAGLGPDYRAPVPDLTRLVCCWIHRRVVELIIIDDAARLDRTCWEILQDIHDRTRCAFLLTGQPDFSRKLQRDPELHSRLSLSLEMVNLTFDELYYVTRDDRITSLCRYPVTLPSLPSPYVRPDRTGSVPCKP